ncbi:hypothetical protein D9M72_614260 [compost metagenome]
MQRTFNFETFQKTVAQARMAVRTDIVGGKKLTVHAIYGQLLASRIHANYVVLRDICRCQNVYPSSRHVVFLIFIKLGK